MITLPYPLGTWLKATIRDVYEGTNPLCPVCVILEDEYGKGHCLMQSVYHEIAPKKGEEVLMEFIQGGALGGFWKIQAAAGETYRQWLAELNEAAAGIGYTSPFEDEETWREMFYEGLTPKTALSEHELCA